MATTEATILSTYLTTPSQLPTVISLKEFTALFPRALQDSPLVRSLYRDLQSQRSIVVDDVVENITIELKTSKGLRRALVAARRQEYTDEYDPDTAAHRMTLGASVSSAKDPKDTLQSVIPKLEDAAEAIETELRQLEKQEARLLSLIQDTLGGMSDLRYGRLANGQLPDQVLEGHANLQETCKRMI